MNTGSRAIPPFRRRSGRPASALAVLGLFALAAAGAAAQDAAPPPGADDAAILERVGRYVVAYHEQLAQVVADERYLQVAPQLPLGNPERTRSLRSEVILVRPEGSATYKLFRDVVEVNGRRVRDREDRLAELFFSSPATMDRIAAESSRYNIGPVISNFNVPTTVLYFLEPANQANFRFEAAGEAEVDGVRTRVYRFTETAQPTLVRFNYKDIPSAGAVWVDPADGRVLRTRLQIQAADNQGRPLNVETVVDFRLVPALGLLAPVEMREEYAVAGNVVFTGRAVYDNFRRFAVQVDQSVDTPPQ
mgnify:CR=1 FL=1